MFLPSMCTSIVFQTSHRVRTGRAARRYLSRDDRYRRQQRRDCGECGWIFADTPNTIPDSTCPRDRAPAIPSAVPVTLSVRPSRMINCRMSVPLRANRHTDADLAHARGNRISHQAVDADGGQDERHTRKRDQKPLCNRRCAMKPSRRSSESRHSIHRCALLDTADR